MSKKSEWLGLMVDFLWSGLVVAPLVVLYWRGTWDLLEDFIYPNRPEGPVAEDAPPQDQVRVRVRDMVRSGSGHGDYDLVSVGW